MFVVSKLIFFIPLIPPSKGDFLPRGRIEEGDNFIVILIEQSVLSLY
jgi:hypothetical protein